MPAPNTAAEIGREVVDRMVALVRRMAEPGWDVRIIDQTASAYAEARAIVALLPEPVDPDLEIAREMLAKFYEAENDRRGNEYYFTSMIADVRAGVKDDTPPVQFALFALKARDVGEGE